jgi:hypothetical protein
MRHDRLQPLCLAALCALLSSACDSQGKPDPGKPSGGGKYSLQVTKAGPGGGTVVSRPEGVNCGSVCAATYEGGTVVTLEARPDSHSTFLGWAGACAGTGECVVTMDDVRAVSANFGRPTHQLTITLAGSGVRSVTSNPAGLVCSNSLCEGSFPAGTMVFLNAAAGVDTTFVSWSGACNVTTRDCKVFMDGPRTATATFALHPMEVLPHAVLVDGGSGTLTSSLGGPECKDYNCPTLFASRDSDVTFTATPAEGTRVTGWSVSPTHAPRTPCGHGDRTCTVTVSEKTFVSVIFARILHTVSTGTAFSDGRGTVTADVGGIQCPGTCTARIGVGTSVTLTATPDANSLLTEWRGRCVGQSSPTCTFVVDQDNLSVYPVFTRKRVTVNASKAGDGTGRIAGGISGGPISGPRIDCGATCSQSFPMGEELYMIATPDADSEFAGWSGDGTTNSVVPTHRSLLADGNKSVGATFNKKRFTLQTLLEGDGTGQVRSAPAGIDCGADCSETYVIGTAVTLTATPGPDSAFRGWKGCTSDTASCTVTLNAAPSEPVKANFARSAYGLQVTKSGTGQGSVKSTQAGIDCGATCSATFPFRTRVELTATPDATSTFLGWSGACSGAGRCVVSVEQESQVSARFGPRLTWPWVKTAQPEGFVAAAAQATAVDSEGNVVMAGYFYGKLDLGKGPMTARHYDAFVARYTRTGTLVWALRFGNDGFDTVRSVAFDAAGDVYVTGSSEGTVDFGGGPRTGTGYDQDTYVARFARDTGAHVWSRIISANGRSSGAALAVHDDGVFLTGTFQSSINFGGGRHSAVSGYPDVYVAGLSTATGAYRWSHALGSTAADEGRAIAAGPDGVVAVGDYERGILLVKFPLAGGAPTLQNLDLTRASGTESHARAYGVGLDAEGNISIAGFFSGTAALGDKPLTADLLTTMFLARFTPRGEHLWSRAYDGRASYPLTMSLAVTPSGELVVGGGFDSSFDFGGQELTTNGGTDAYVAKYAGTDGALRWVRRYGDKGNDDTWGVAVDNQGDVVACGAFGGTIDFGTGPVTASAAGFLVSVGP